MSTGSDLFTEAAAAIEPGGRLVASRELTGGSSATVHRLDLVTADGRPRPVVFRQHHQAGFKGHGSDVAAREHIVLQSLHSLGFPVPRPLHSTRSGATTSPYLVLEWVDGESEVAPTDRDDAVDEMADLLARLHAVEPADSLRAALAPLDADEVDLASWLPESEIGRALGDFVAAGPTPPGPGRRALIHGDYWPGNILWNQGQLVALIDWEDAAIGDQLVDLAAARVELVCAFGQASAERFTTRYLEAADLHQAELERLSWWEAFVSASALATMHQWQLDPAEERLRRAHTTEFFERAAGTLLAG